MRSTFKKKKTKSAGTSLTTYFIIAGLVGLVLTIYIGYRASISNKTLFHFSLLALFGGLLFESIRVTDNWRTVIGIFIGAYLFSLIGFFPGKHEHNYSFEEHIKIWPYFFLVIFAMCFGVFHKERVTTKLNEGMTLVLSLSLIYWTIDYGFTDYFNWFSIPLMVIGLLFSIFSIIHALTYFPLTRSVRLTLSIWSSFIFLAFAIDSIIKVFSNPDIEGSKYLSDGMFIALQYFLLGVTAIYITRNFMLLVSFLPSKNGNHKRELWENKRDHVDRYSNKQVNIVYSLLLILSIGFLYWLNHKYQVLPRHTAIWVVFFTSSIILKVLDFFKEGKSY